MTKRTTPSQSRRIPYSEIAIGGKTYRMAFDLGSLSDAEDALLARGHDVNLAVRLPRVNLSNTRVLFAASLQAYHPEVDFELAKTWVTRENLYDIIPAMLKAWEKNTPDLEPAKADPPPPDQ